jgi:HPt (histidine-containing phosphotransfer) domain-containing protein
MADKDVTISRLVLQNDLLRSQVFALEQTNAQLQQEIRQLRADRQKLQDQIARLKRNSSNSSKPPSSDIVKPAKKGAPRRKGKRKIGGQKGHPRQERIPFGPDDIDATRFHVLAEEQVQDLIPLDDWFIQQQVDLVQKLYRVTEHRARKYLDPRTGRIVIAPLPAAVKAAGLVGPNLSALAAYQKGDCHMSYSTIQRFWNEVLGIHHALKKGFSLIYGYTSDEGGIRHAMIGENKCDFDDAKYMLVSCSAFLNYLAGKASKAGLLK